MRSTNWAWVTPGAFLAAALLAGCGGGGGGGGGSSPAPTTPPGVITITSANGGHGFVTLNWSQPNAGSGATYTIQRETGNGSGQPAANASFENLPTAAGGAANVSGTSYQDPSYPDFTSNGAQTVSYPSVGNQYLYTVTNTVTGQVSNTFAATSVVGPGVGYTIETTTPPSSSPTPFANSTSYAHFAYTASASNASAPVITMHFVFDYPVTTTADVDHITINVAGGAFISNTAGYVNDVTFSHAQIQSGLSINANNNHEVDFSSATAGLTIPTATPYSLVALTAYVTPADAGASSSAVPIEFCDYLYGSGTTQSYPEGLSAYNSQYNYTLQELP